MNGMWRYGHLGYGVADHAGWARYEWQCGCVAVTDTKQPLGLRFRAKACTRHGGDADAALVGCTGRQG